MSDTDKPNVVKQPYLCTDIPKRLRWTAKFHPNPELTKRAGVDLLNDAADEIERLRAKLTAIQSQIVNLPRTGTADKIYTLAKIETE